MTADGYRPAQSRSGSALSALMLSGTIVTGLALWSPGIRQRIVDPPIIIHSYPVPPEHVPPPEPHPQPSTPAHAEHVIATRTIERTPPDAPIDTRPSDIFEEPAGTVIGSGTGTGTGTAEPPPLPPPPFVAASISSSSSLQPPYPPEEANAGREGVVTVRVHIGADGRVTAVEQVDATSPAFFRAAQRWAIGHWRFHPATRGGVPEDSWKVMRLRFELNE